MTGRADLFRTSHDSSPSSPFFESRTDIALAANESIRRAQSLLEETIDVGISVQDRMASQGSLIGRSADNVQKIIGKIPGIGNLANKIEVKRKRDRLILGGLIGFLMFFCVWWLFG
jgi:Golgi SNAP receptor complex protein 1